MANKPLKNKNIKSKLKKMPVGKAENRRIKIFLTVTGFIFFIVILRLFQLQVVMGNALREESLSMRRDESEIIAERGSILDTNGIELAVDASVYSLWIDPSYLRQNLGRAEINKEEASELIGQAVDLQTDFVLRKIELNSGFVWLKKEVSFEEVEKIKNLGLIGLYFQEEGSRYYPNHAVGGNLIGFVNKTGVGVAGLEATYNNILKGQNGLIKGEKDGQNNYIADTVKTIKEAEPGNSIVLTIDQKAQYIAEREIAKIEKDLEPESATIMVMETKTGAIVASANTNNYDSNSYRNLDINLYRTLEYQNIFEPGSTMKVITAAAAINEGVANENSIFYDNTGSRTIGTNSIKCWIYPRAHGKQTLTQAVANSCNPVLIDVAMLLKNKNPDLWYDYLRKFGFGTKTKIGFSGEGNGILPAGNGDIYHATSAIGQGIAVSPVQMISAISAVANNGQKMKPYLVKEIKDQDGKVKESFEPIIENQVVSKDAAEAVQRMMKAVVDTGTGTKFKLNNNIESMGKTGTAQKVNELGQYKVGKYIISYVGIAPYSNPKYTVFVIIDEAKTNGQSSTTVAPYYKAVMEDILALYSVSDSTGINTINNKLVMPDLTGLNTIDAKNILSNLGLNAEFIGSGHIILQSIGKKSLVSKGEKVILTAKEHNLTGTQTIVPALTGLRLPDALKLAENASLVLQYTGEGKIVEQNIAPGSVVLKNSSLVIRLGE
ncbi:MAG: stage V sporulation protein D (sporulation-specific penicillin-binding protein) [Fusobacteria bacterium]|nr:MAG: stage V sporulation protein D (sporulation-specific penicillin-binding protein) [Fusobacteriota bacterium]KAF0229947.1 MAG: stage V sporulation protein D [Fusobacteriota bacterium]